MWLAVLFVAFVAAATSYVHRLELRGIEHRANAITLWYRSQDSIKQLLLATRANQDFILSNQIAVACEVKANQLRLDEITTMLKYAQCREILRYGLDTTKVYHFERKR